MTYRAKMQDGEVVFQDGIKPADGSDLQIDVVESTRPPESTETLSESLLKLAGRAKGLPPDAAKNHDHYLYGTPKR